MTTKKRDASNVWRRKLMCHLRMARSGRKLMCLLRSWAILVLLIAAAARDETPATYTNPLPMPEHIADPFIFREGDTYYLYGTAAGDGLLVWTSNDLVNWRSAGTRSSGRPKRGRARDFWRRSCSSTTASTTSTSPPTTATRREGRFAASCWPKAIRRSGRFEEIKAPWFETDRPTDRRPRLPRRRRAALPLHRRPRPAAEAASASRSTSASSTRT